MLKKLFYLWLITQLQNCWIVYLNINRLLFPIPILFFNLNDDFVNENGHFKLFFESFFIIISHLWLNCWFQWLLVFFFLVRDLGNFLPCSNDGFWWTSYIHGIKTKNAPMYRKKIAFHPTFMDRLAHHHRIVLMMNLNASARVN